MPYVLLFAIRFLDPLGDADADRRALLDPLARFLPPDGVVHVQGGADDENLRLEAAVGRRLVVDFAAASPAAALEWRGCATVTAIAVLRVR